MANDAYRRSDWAGGNPYGHAAPGPHSMHAAGDPMAMLAGAVSPGPQQQSQSLWELLDDRLRGRWTYMLIIGTILAGILGVVGYRTTQPTFSSEGVIRVVPEQFGYGGDIIDGGSRQPEGERATQALLVQSRRVLELALNEDKLASHPIAQQPNIINEIEDGLEVTADRQSELIYVTFSSESPELAQIVVNAVLDAYYDIFGSQGGEDMSERMQSLLDHESDLDRQIKSWERERQTLLATYDTLDLRDWQRRKLERVAAVESQLLQAETLLSRSEPPKNVTSEGEDEGEEKASIIPTDLALERMNSRLALLADERNALYAEFERIKARFKPDTHQYRMAQDAYHTARRLYEDERRITLERWETSGGEPLDEDTRKLAGMSPEQLRSEIDILKSQIEELRQESKQASDDILAVDNINNELARLQDKLDWVRGRIGDLELNEPVIREGRISIAQEATYPLEVSSDGRKKRAVVGAAGGFGLSFLAFFLLGTIDRRAFGAQQLKSAQGRALPPCLGVLPDLSRAADDPEANDVAAHCVHQIRNQIEAQRPAEQGYVLAVSSPCQGDGKTSIVLSLGWSYAAAGYRTLMVDCDLVGRSLTRQLGMVGRPGLRESLTSKAVNGEIVPLSMPCLSALPAGHDSTFGPERVRRHGLDVLFEQVRPHFDIIIVDTGPILGSLESTPVISAADGVILSVRRGRSRTKLDEAVNRMETLRGHCLGVVLNWAVRADCYRYVSETSLPTDEGVREEDDGRRSVSISSPASGQSNALILAMEQTATPQRPQPTPDSSPNGTDEKP